MIVVGQPTPKPNTTSSDDVAGASKKPESPRESSGKRILGAEETVEKTNDALTEEFVARTAIDMVNVRMMLQPPSTCSMSICCHT